VVKQPNIGPWPSVLQLSRHVMTYGERLSAFRPTLELEDQTSLFTIPEDGVALLYPRHWEARNLESVTIRTHNNCNILNPIN
jgi:hypothetical protein